MPNQQQTEARKLFSEKQFLVARKIYENVEPSSLRASDRIKLAHCCFFLSDLRAAADHYADLYAKREGNLTTYFRFADILYDSFRYQESKEVCSTLLGLVETESQKTRIKFLMSLIEREISLTSDPLSEVQVSLALDLLKPRSKAKADFANSHFDESYRTFQLIEDKLPLRAEECVQQCDAAYELGKDDSAESILTRAIEARGLKNVHKSKFYRDILSTKISEQKSESDPLHAKCSPSSISNANQRFRREKQAELKAYLESEQRIEFPSVKRVSVSVVIVTFNSAELTYACLKALRRSIDVEFEVIIVDNASSDTTDKLLESLSNVQVIYNKKNLHFLAAANQGANYASGQAILFLNSDAFVEPDSIRNALNTLSSKNNIAAVGAKLLFLNGQLQEAGCSLFKDASASGYGMGMNPMLPYFMNRRDVDYCSGAFLMVRSEHFLKLGGFDPIYSPAYYEETDLCARLWELGLRTVYEPTAIVHHHTFGSAVSSQDAHKTMSKNKLVFTKKRNSFLEGQSEQDIEIICQNSRLSDFKKSLLIIDDRIPRESRGSGSPRMLKMISCIQQLGYKVSFYPTTFNNDESWDSIYELLDREVEVIFGESFNLNGLEHFWNTHQHRFGTVLTSRIHNLKTFLRINKEAPKDSRSYKLVYDTEALSYRRELRKSKVLNLPILESDLEEKAKAELKSLDAVHSVLVVSENEKRFLSESCNKSLNIVGHFVKPKTFFKPFEDRSDFLFVGSFYSEDDPNFDSIKWFTENVWPTLDILMKQSARLLVVGNDATSKLSSVISERISLVGKVDDLDSYYENAKVFVAPTRYSSGIPLKVIEAAGHGVPVVSTEALRNQLNWENGREILSSDLPHEFAKHCYNLSNQKSLWEGIQKAALERIEREHNKESFTSALRTSLI